ncbi:MAG: transcriptional regulator [Flavobacterium sp.]|uniref:transcriptional regulator n=1 Tax=Flavobacterium sp. TaxID=239 RepID=UPI00273691F5|nr:transcriptional regulator [Flavobacterium sp.]MDP3680049.1 transcriptional regulator [Flavobacterium sp.]MDZ4331859.1 transcriptional regulator [Flavobacterium sp.]
MNYIKHLTGFFNKINYEPNLNPTHISLYLALFQCWNVNRFKNPTGISREEIMKSSKIHSKATYHKCMKELELLGFMVYNPTFNPHSCSNIIMVNFSEEEKRISKIPQSTRSENEPLHNLTESKNEQVIEQVNEQVYIYNKKQTVKNNLNNTKIDIEKISIDIPVQNLNPVITPREKEIKTDSPRQILPVFAATDKKQTEREQQKEKNCAKKEKPVELDLFFETTTDNQTEISLHKFVTSSEVEKPSLEMILEYFSFKESSHIEANKFFNYYSSIGWLIGGKTKMKDWKAAARNWMLNTAKFGANTQKSDYNSQPKPMHLHTVTQKNYDEPL